MKKVICFALAAASLAALVVLFAAAGRTDTPPLGALPHDTLLTVHSRAFGREELYVRDFAYNHGFIQDQGRYSVAHGWSGNVEQQSVLVCPIRRVGGEIEARIIHDTRLEGECALRGND